MKYEKIKIKSEKDLPEKEGRYFACIDRHNSPTEYGWLDFDDTLRSQWFTEVTWYFSPVKEMTDEQITDSIPYPNPVSDHQVNYNIGWIRGAKFYRDRDKTE